MNREYLLLSPKTNTESGSSISNGETILLGDDVTGITTCVSLKGVRGTNARVGSLRVPLPEVNKAVLLYDEHAQGTKWTVLPSQPAGQEGLKMFICCEVIKGPVGIRTSWNWNHTFWCTELSQFPGCWIVPISVLKEGLVEYKMVSGSDENLEWEPCKFKNKTAIISSGTQVICANWASYIVSSRDIAVYSKDLTVSVSVSQGTEVLLQDNLGSIIVLTNCKDQNNKLVFPKGEHVFLYWSESFQTYTVTLCIPGRLTKLRFGLAIMDELGNITHVADHCFSKDKSERHWELYPGKEDNIESGNFTDVRPLQLRQEVGQFPLTSPLQSVCNMLRNIPSSLDSKTSLYSSGSKTLSPGVRMSLYKDLMAAADKSAGLQQEPDNTPSKSSKKSKSFTKSLSRAFSLKKMSKKSKDANISQAADSADSKGALYSPRSNTWSNYN